MMGRSLLDVRAARTRSITAPLGELVLAAIGAYLIAISAQVRIPVPTSWPTRWGSFSPVPITAQTLTVLLVGALLGSRVGVLTLGLYLVGGAAGLPFFAGGALFGPTGGYLVGFVGAAYLVGRSMELGWVRDARTAFLTLLAGNVVIYLVGLPWLAGFVGWSAALPLGLYPFVVGDFVKLVAAAGVVSARCRLK